PEPKWPNGTRRSDAGGGFSYSPGWWCFGGKSTLSWWCSRKAGQKRAWRLPRVRTGWTKRRRDVPHDRRMHSTTVGCVAARQPSAGGILFCDTRSLGEKRMLPASTLAHLEWPVVCSELLRRVVSR